jgi:hypothetical protein
MLGQSKTAPLTALGVQRRPPARHQNFQMERRLKTVVALMVALAVACVLISPLPDELPGTAVKHGLRPFVVPAGPGFHQWGARSTMITTRPEAVLRLTADVLAVTCVRLC